MDVFDDEPIEVIRGSLQASSLFNVVIYFTFAVFLVAGLPANESGGWFVGFAVAFLGLSAAWLIATLRTRIEIHRAGLVRRYRFRTYRYAWGDIAKVVIGPGHRYLNPRPAPVLVLPSGKRIELVELKAPLWVPLSGVSVSPGGRALVEAVTLRTDGSDELEATATGPGLSPPPRAWVVGPLVACLGFFVVALAVAMVVVPFVGSTADVDPTRLAAGRVYYGEPTPQGGTGYWVDCPRPVTSAFASDPICRRDGRDALRRSALGLAFSIVCAALLIWYVRHLRRRHQLWNDAARTMNA